MYKNEQFFKKLIRRIFLDCECANLLTPDIARDKIPCLRVRSSMVEQWPFKPLVAGSSPAALTNPQEWGFFLLYPPLLAISIWDWV